MVRDCLSNRRLSCACYTIQPKDPTSGIPIGLQSTFHLESFFLEPAMNGIEDL